MTYLFLANVGPIQSFIASARRTRDLYFGSTLLSEVSKTVARTLNTYDNTLLIFPAPADLDLLQPNTGLKVPNKILARIEEDPGTVGEKIERAKQTYIEELSSRLFEKLRNRASPDNASTTREQFLNQEVARVQIKSLVELIWVALQEDDDPKEANKQYRKNRAAIERLLAARKNTRSYSKVPWPIPSANAPTEQQKAPPRTVPKSSIDGNLESVISESLYPHRRESQAVQAQKASTLFKLFGAGKAERLSGVDLLKRLGEFGSGSASQEQNPFFSTSHIAALPYLQGVQTLIDAHGQDAQTKIQKSWDDYIEKVKNIHRPPASNQKNDRTPSPVVEYIPPGKKGHAILGRRDGALLYGERLLEDAFSPEKALDATKELESFFRTVNTYSDKNSLLPSPYYAIVVADGDGMGKIIDHESRNEQGAQRHRAISLALDAFDGEVEKIVEGKNSSQGGLVYSGGDDVLAFVPLHRVLPCVKRLADAFKAHLGDKDDRDGFKNAEGKPATLSVGVAIVHHLLPLNDALDQGRAAEKAAKAVSGKDALAIKLCKRGGEEYTISGHWGNLDSYLEKLIPHYQKKRIPKGLPYELRESLLRLTALKDETHADKLIPVIKADAKRILERKIMVPRRKLNAESEALLRLLAGRIEIDLDERPAPPQQETASYLRLDGLETTHPMKLSTFYRLMQTYIHEFVIASELADAYTLAGVPVQQVQEEQL